MFIRGCCGYGGIVLGNLSTAVLRVQLLQHLFPAEVPPAQFGNSVLSNTKWGGCIYWSMHSFKWQKCQCNWVEGVFGAVAGEGFGETIQGDEVGSRNLFMVIGH